MTGDMFLESEIALGIFTLENSVSLLKRGAIAFEAGRLKIRDCLLYTSDAADE